MRSRIEPLRAVVFDRPAWEAWLETRTPEHAAELRAGIELADWFDTEYAKMQEEKMNDHPNRNND